MHCAKICSLGHPFVNQILIQPIEPVDTIFLNKPVSNYKANDSNLGFVQRYQKLALWFKYYVCNVEVFTCSVQITLSV